MSGAAAGSAAASAKDHQGRAALAAAYKSNTAYAAHAEDGASLGGKAGAFFQRAFTGETSADTTERLLKSLENRRKAVDDLVTHADNKAKTTDWTTGNASKTVNGRNVTVSGNYQAWTFAKKAAEDQNAASFTFNGHTYTLEEANAIDFDFMKANATDYIQKHGAHGGTRDAEFDKKAAKAESTNPGLHITNTTTRGILKNVISDTDREIQDHERGQGVRKANSDSTKPS